MPSGKGADMSELQPQHSMTPEHGMVWFNHAFL